jgi:hypothetical protein
VEQPTTPEPVPPVVESPIETPIINTEGSNMLSKIKEMLGSISFWQSVAGAIVLILATNGVISWDIAIIIAGWCGVGITKRTVDKSITQ